MAITMPAGIANDQLLLVLMNVRQDGDLTAPSGWTQIANAVQISVSNDLWCRLYAKKSVSSDSEAVYTWSTGGGTNRDWQARALYITGADVSGAIADVLDGSTSSAPSSSSSSISVASITTTRANGLYLWWLAWTSSDITLTGPTGPSQLWKSTANGNANQWPFSENLGAAGATGTRNATASASRFHVQLSTVIKALAATTITGAVPAPAPTSNGTLSAGPLTASGTGAAAASGAGVLAVGPLAVSGAVAFASSGTGAATLGPVTLQGAGAVAASGAGAAALGPLESAGAANTGAAIGAGSATGGPLTLSGNAAPAAIGTGVASIGAAVTVAGSAVAPAPASESIVALGPLTLVGAADVTSAAAGALTLGPLLTAGAGAAASSGMGSALVGNVLIVGSAQAAAIGSGGALLGTVALPGDRLARVNPRNRTAAIVAQSRRA
jgi:hypothetical protein